MRIVRNLGILNILLSVPTLSDQYKTGPLEENLTINAIIRIGTLKKDNKKRAIIKSKTRFITIYFDRSHKSLIFRILVNVGKKRATGSPLMRFLMLTLYLKKMKPANDLLHGRINSGLFFMEYTDSLVMNNPELSLNLLLFKSCDQCFYGFGQVR